MRKYLVDCLDPLPKVVSFVDDPTLGLTETKSFSAQAFLFDCLDPLPNVVSFLDDPTLGLTETKSFNAQVP